MPQGSVERRRGRRANVQAPLLIRRYGEGGLQTPKEETTKNISLAGVYFETDEAGAYAVNDVVMASVSVPTASTREFPFTRLAGRGRVVRVNERAQEGSTSSKQFSVALEFGQDLTVLTAIPTRG